MKTTFIALCALAFAPLAAAQLPPPADGSAYVGVHAGESNFDIACDAPLNCDEKDKAYKLALGWQFNRYIAAELAYSDLGQANLEAGAGAFVAHLHATAYELSAIGTYPLGEVFSLLGRLGLLQANTKYGGALGGEHNSKATTFGFGLQVDFTRNVTLRLQWQRFNNLKTQIQRPTEEPQERGDVDMLSVGILLRPR